MYCESFPSKLKKARNDTGFTQREVAKELGITQSVLARYETGKLEPNIEVLGLLIDFYNISADWLIGTKGGKQN
ncbi:MAG: helix-turn-helix domain-containing protein [Clostridium sp.]|nr:helix-turn-helix domain-containing protein [Clostridium sp.]